LVELAFSYVGISDWHNYVKIDPRFKRPAEVVHLKSRPTKVKEKLGWSPKVAFPELVKMMVEADLARHEAKRQLK
jgi:GDPmannose 4,6-dehydratase